MKRTLAKAKARKVDKVLTIYDLFDGKGFNFDFVIAELTGDHPAHVNRISDRAYYILSGSGLVTVANEQYEVARDDLIVIKAGTSHAIKGTLKFIIITAPRFDPAHES